MDIDFLTIIIVSLIVLIGFGILWRSIFFLIAKKVKITIEEKEISFNAENKTINILPYVYISKSKKRNRLLAIGIPPASVDDFITVNILTPQKENEFDAPIEECVEAFFRTAFYQLFNRKILLYIVATVEGVGNFQSALGHNYKENLDKCLERSCTIKREYA